MVTVETELVDTDTFYGEIDDVQRQFRGRTEFGDVIDLDDPDVERELRKKSEQVDNVTNRAWRERRLEDYYVKPEVSYAQESGTGNRLNINFGYSRTGFARQTPDIWVPVYLPHVEIREIEDLSVEYDRIIRDIGDDEGREDGQWWLDTKNGIVYINRQQFPTKGTSTRDYQIDTDRNLQVKVTYTYGSDYDVPLDIVDATALLVSDQLINSDQYSDLVPGSDGGAPDQSQSASRYKEQAMDILKNYARSGKV